MTFMALMGDYYFDLNDDVLMKDILSGAYTGVPEGNNIQMLYPISAFISLLYRINIGPDWYGIFLCTCQFACVFMVSYRLLSRIEDRLMKWSLAGMLLFFMLGVIGSHFLFVQYTFTCGLLSATSVVMIMTKKEGDASLVLSAVLIAIAYLLRSEMLLLTLPVVGVAVLTKWALERKEILSYIEFLVAIALVIVLSQGIHRIANSPSDWKEFNRFFDARTELYDFQYIPDYDENRAFYDGIGLSESEQQLLVNYNFGLDDEINADILFAVAQYAADMRTEEIPLPKKLAGALVMYLYRLRHIAAQKSYEYPMSDFPWNVVTLVLYAGVVVSALFPKAERDRKKLLLLLGLLATLFACRTTLWLYIIARGRDPIRITHPLYLMEIAVLIGILIMNAAKSPKCVTASLIVLLLIGAASFPNQTGIIGDELDSRQLMRTHYDALYDYFHEHRDSFYYIDVYTAVSAGEDADFGEATFSEKMFENVDNTYANHDLMGGWASKSPLYYKKAAAFGLPAMEEALLLPNVYIIQNRSGDLEWISDYYREKGRDVSVYAVDVVADTFAVIRVSQTLP